MDSPTLGLLRLDAYTLGYLLSLVGAADILHLLQSGNPALSAYIALGMTSFSGVFKASGFVDCNANLRFLTAFPRLRRLTLSTLCPEQRVLSPIDWTIATSNLTHLSLTFCGCIDSLLALKASLGTRLASLIHLSLHDPGSFEIVQPHDDIDFSIFPPGLTHLELKSNRRTPLVLQSLAKLPRGLLTLILDVVTTFAPFSASQMLWTTLAHHLGNLPENLEHLHVRNSRLGEWHVSFERLPTTLKVFKLDGMAYHPSLVSISQRRSLIDLQGIALFGALRVFDCAEYRLPFSAFKSLPPNIQVTAQLVDDTGRAYTIDDPNENFESLKPLTSFSASLRTNTDGLGALISAFASPGFCLSTLELSTANLVIKELPPTLTSLNVIDLYAFPPRLVSLRYTRSCYMDYEEILQGLPSTLKKLAAPFDFIFWSAVLARCDAGTLPAFFKIDFHHTQLLGSPSADDTSQLPLQLREVSFAMVNTTDSFLKSLQRSHISVLRVSRMANSGLLDESSILNHLPPTLKLLMLNSPLPPPNAVDWPTGLHTLFFGSDSLSTYFKAGTAFTTLPKSLVSLIIECKDTKKHLNVYRLPQTISDFQAISRYDEYDFFPSASIETRRYYRSKYITPLTFCSPAIGFEPT